MGDGWDPYYTNVELNFAFVIAFACLKPIRALIYDGHPQKVHAFHKVYI